MNLVARILLSATCVLSPLKAVSLFELNSTERELFEAISGHPSQRRTVMQLDPRLCAIARQHCQDMNDGGFFAHFNPHTKKDANDRLRDIGYPAPAWYTAGQNFIESLTLNNPEDGETATLSWLNSPSHKVHVFGEKNPNGSEFYLNQTLIGVGYVEKNGGLQGYYAFISAHPPEAQEWRLPATFLSPGLSNHGDAFVLTGIPANGVFVLEESEEELTDEWEIIACGFADPNSPPSFPRPDSNQKFYRIRWTPQ
ncbi:MAG: CAP domain-containing protein [Verrucomicrobiaceae bacterium]